MKQIQRDEYASKKTPKILPSPTGRKMFRRPRDTLATTGELELTMEDGSEDEEVHVAAFSHFGSGEKSECKGNNYLKLKIKF